MTLRRPPIHGCSEFRLQAVLLFSLISLFALVSPLLATAQDATPTTATTTQAEDPSPSPPADSPSDPGFHLALEPTEAQIGTAVTLRLEADDPAVNPDRIVDIALNLDHEKWHTDSPFRRLPASRDGKQPACWQAVVRPFEPGKQDIPPLKVAWRDAAGQPAEAWTTTATLHVLNLRPANSEEWTLIPLRDIAEIPRDWSWIWSALGLLLVCIAAAWFLVRWWCRRTGVATAVLQPELPPGIWALRELDYRSRLPVCQNGPPKAIFSHVSEVVRLYLGRRYGVAAIDMTTHECMQALQALGLGDEVLRWVREFLEECDLVKFTTIEPSRERWRTIWHDARLIVKMTTPPEELGESPTAELAREAVS